MSEYPDGSAATIALGGGNFVALAKIEKRGFLSVFETLYIRNRHLVLMLLSGLLVGLIILLWHRRKIKSNLELIKRQKKEIERTHAQLNAAFNALPDIIFEVDRRGLIYMFRSPMPDLLPNLPREYMDKKISDSFPPDVSEIIMQAIAGATRAGRFSGSRFELETPRGHLWFELSIAAKGDLEQDNCRFVVLARDITLRVKTEHDLRAALNRERILINANHDIALLVDQDGIISSVNNAAAERLGSTPEKMVGNCAYDYMRPEAAENRRSKMAEMLSRGEPLIYEEYFPYGAFLNSIHPIFNEQGEVEQVGIFARDITEHHRALERLRESEERYRTLQDNVPVAVFRTRVDGKVMSLNPAAARMFGYDHMSEMMTLSAEETYVDPDKRKEFLRELSNKGYISDFQIECVRKNNTTFWISLSARAIKDADGAIEYIDGVATDITEKKSAEGALRESEEKYRALVETTKTGFVIVNGRGVVIDANDEYIRQTGRISREDVIGHSVLEWTAEYDIDKNREAVINCYKDGSIYNFEVDYAGPYGKITPIEINATVVKTTAGMQIHTLCRDITARKASEEYMRLLSLGIEQSSEGIAIANLDGKFIFVNRAFADMHGYESSELIERHYSVLHNEDQLVNIKTLAKRLLETGTYDGELWHVRKDGECFPSLMHVSMIRGKNGQNIGVVVAVRDITTLKKTEEALIKAHTELEMGAEKALRLSEEKYRSVVENVPSDIVAVDMEGNILFANEAAARTHRRRTSQLIGQKLQELFPEEQADYNMGRIREVIASGNKYFEELERFAGGEWRWFDVNIQPFKDSEGKTSAALVIANDITERHRTEESRKALDREKYEQAKYIAGGIAHEINNSLAPALISLDKLTERLGKIGDSELERNRHLLQLSLSAINRAINMTDLVTAYSRLEAEKQHDEIKFDELLQEVIGEHEDQLRDLRVAVDINVNPELIFKCHRDHAHSLFNNLVINSLDALTAAPEPRLFFNARPDNGHLAIEVGDNGSGMNPEVRKRAFDVFFSTKHATGTGLGLAVVKRIVDLYDGKIDIRSELNSGTTFTILWPEYDTLPQASGK